MPFITFEGIDGSGKSTQLRLLAERLRDAGRDVVEAVEPGGTEAGRQIRRILLEPAPSSLDERTELLLYFASRAQNIAEVIRPALVSNKIVLCDRFTDSTIAYQGYGRGLDLGSIVALDGIACDGVHPNLTILLDIDPATSLSRARFRNHASANRETRFEDEPGSFHSRVRDGYLQLAKEQKERFVIVNGEQSAENVASSIWQGVAHRV